MIHPTAIVDPGAQVPDSCQIGPYCIVGPQVRLGESCRLHSHVVVDGDTVLGSHNEIFPFCSIGLKTQDLKWKGGTTLTRIGDHNTFREYVTIHSATGDGEITAVGSYNNILAYGHVAHNVIMGSHIILSNSATLGGHVMVEDHAIVSGLAAVHQFVRIGRFSIIGGCSKVVQDVTPYMIVDGNPATTDGLNKVGMDRRGIPEESQEALKKAFRILFRDGLIVKNALERIEAELPALPEILHLVRFARETTRGLTMGRKRVSRTS